jgi:diaminohydroxyphosphoribosylaminopyrimidine deaminase / 5-amino-6-(5-phosphoribosylamino)uracil reductase
MSYAFAGVIGLGAAADLPAWRTAIGGRGMTISDPFAGFVHCAAPGAGYAMTQEDEAALLAASRGFPGRTFAWIEVSCFGGACAQRGFVFGDGEVLHTEPHAMDSDRDSVLMRLCARIGASLSSPRFAPFERGVFRFDDAAWMSRALALARRQLGRVAPNPAVGCVIVDGQDLVGEAATGDGGRPHAEESALAAAEDRAEGATAYVTLEPCSARSSGAPSCTDRLIAAGVARVVIGCPDPNPAAAHGARVLAAGGIDIRTGVLGEEAEGLNAGFFKRVQTGRPWVAISASPVGFDAECVLAAGEDAPAMLDRLGRAGLTRVFARPDSPEARRLADLGLADPS